MMGRAASFMFSLTFSILASSCVETQEGGSSPADTTLLLPVNGTELFVHRIGGGEPIVGVHGGPVLEHGYFLPHFERLAADFELIFFDQRLSGRSAGSARSISSPDRTTWSPCSF